MTDERKPIILRDMPQFSVVLIPAVVVDQNRGQTMLYIPGPGLWSVPSTVQPDRAKVNDPDLVSAAAREFVRHERERPTND